MLLEAQTLLGSSYLPKVWTIIFISCILVSKIVVSYLISDSAKAPGIGGYRHGVGRESRQITLQKGTLQPHTLFLLPLLSTVFYISSGHKRIKAVGQQLRLNNREIETAYNFYKMAVAQNLTRGRKQTHTVAACLYLVCRMEGLSRWVCLKSLVLCYVLKVIKSLKILLL